jgi:hypothetical protein
MVTVPDVEAVDDRLETNRNNSENLTCQCGSLANGKGFWLSSPVRRQNTAAKLYQALATKAAKSSLGKAPEIRFNI